MINQCCRVVISAEGGRFTKKLNDRVFKSGDVFPKNFIRVTLSGGRRECDISVEVLYPVLEESIMFIPYPSAVNNER